MYNNYNNNAQEDNMKKIFALVFTALTIFFTCFSSACKPQYYSSDFYYFNTHINLVTKNKAASNSTLENLNSLFSSIEKEFSLSKESSLTTTFNASKKDMPINLSEVGLEVIKLTKESYDFTNKKFNPAVFPFVKLWSFYPNYPILNFTPPTTLEIENLLSLGVTDYDYVVLDEKSKTLSKTLDGVEIDLGGIVKGYALDKASKILIENGYVSGYISVGSSSMFIMQSEALKIKHPRANPDTPIIISVNLQNESNLFVSTSGDYEKTYTYDGKTYSHIINPKTGYPMDTGIISATVIGKNGGMLDALSTALCLCSYEKDNASSKLILMMNKIAAKYSGCKIFVVYNKGSDKIIITNQKEGNDFSLLDKKYTIKNV